MLRRKSQVEILERVPLFSRCSKRELAGIARVATDVELPEGAVIVVEGEESREFYAIVSGTAEVRRRDGWLNALEEGDFFGEIAILAGGPRSATVTATSPLRLLVVGEEDFKHLLEQMPGLQRKVLSALADRLTTTAL